MRGTILIFLFMIAVIWDLAQNNGYWIRYLSQQASLALQSIGVL